MDDQHWFDDLSAAIAQRAGRRDALRSVLAILSSLGLATQDKAAASEGKRRRHKKEKGVATTGNNTKRNRKKDKGKNGQKKTGRGNCKDRFQNLRIKDPHCSLGRCKEEWPGNPCEEKYCEFICNQCDESDPREFCIVGDRLGLPPAAICCLERSSCCGGECCGVVHSGGRQQCCDGHCRHIDLDPSYCGGCDNACGGGEICEAGFCVCGPGITADGTCGDPGGCPDALTNCDGQCVDTSTDTLHCGGCGAACILGQRCQEGECQHRCGGYYCSAGQACCETFCGIGGCN